MFKNFISDILLNHIQSKLNISVINVDAVSGGDINNVYRLQCDDYSYLLKVNDRYKYPDMFAKEQQGLDAIRETNAIAVPEVVLQGEFGNESYLILEWINVGSANMLASSKLGMQLTHLHKSTNPRFGFYTNNYTGSLIQTNNWYTTWSDFFIEQRLQPMVKMAADKNELTRNDVHQFDQLYKKLPGLFTEEPPALLHGDLWGGNYLIDTDGKPYLIDPAVSYGNREFDIAMTTLFGGFDRAFYEAYNNEFPLQHGWQQRLKLWNLYPLLIHVNLFGGMYAKQVGENLSLFI
ncbi:Fructosamine-3-kinase [Mucilaginibacter gossypiicola]|uniref:Fructosamine-3-kinase n=1 Tax=Mucilaginibacter gossypiicola TaxID=551995 RepID=A0A1H7ZJH1_9SPHI|nr:fructosamine kinase family protein [Mucilaginibacter gossypiicola]SEM58423.1 Fructosamine-3-kinase [Mucilaginibacter gossypiicola]